MKKTKKVLLTAAALTSALNLTSCYREFCAVYGPPPDELESPSQTAEQSISDSYTETTEKDSETAVKEKTVTTVSQTDEKLR